MTTAIAPIDAFRADLTRMQPEFKKALPPHVHADKFTRVVMSAVQANPDVLQADKRSLFGACMKSAQDGLLPDGREAALTIYNTKNGKVVQYMPMIAGILKKARNSGEISTIAAELVYKNDPFSYRIENGKPQMTHEPQIFGDRGEVMGAYACAVLKDGSTMIEVMSKAEIEQVRQVSRAKDSGPWTSWWGEMARKTVLRRLSKRLPSSSDREEDLIRTIQADDEITEFDTPAPEREVNPTPPPAKHKRPRNLQRVVDSVDEDTGEVIDAGPEDMHEVPPSDQDTPI